MVVYIILALCDCIMREEVLVVYLMNGRCIAALAQCDLLFTILIPAAR